MVIFITEWGHDFAAVHNVQYMMGPCFLFYFIIFLSYVLADGLWGTLLQQLYFLSETIKQAMRKTNYWRRLNTTNVRSEQQRNSTIRGLERWPLCVRGHRLVFLLILLFFSSLYFFYNKSQGPAILNVPFMNGHFPSWYHKSLSCLRITRVFPRTVKERFCQQEKDDTSKTL